MTEDEQHEAQGCMVHRGLVEQRQHEKQLAEAVLMDKIEQLESELDKARERIRHLEYRVNYLERW